MNKKYSVQTLVISVLVSVLMAGSGSYFSGMLKPSRDEVSEMIRKEAPATVYETLRSLEIQQAEMRTDLKNILLALNKKGM